MSGVEQHGRVVLLPEEWSPLRSDVLTVALEQALAALSGDAAVERVSRYYDRSGGYAGTLFLDVEPNNDAVIEASDLFAVTTLSMRLDARAGRLLLDPGDARENIRRHLRAISPAIAITDLNDAPGGSVETLRRMYELHRDLRELLGGLSNRWVFAAKLCARKRPRLFPVRDNLVCGYLGAGRPLKTGSGWPGDFSVDIQIYASLLTSTEVRSGLTSLRGRLHESGVRVDFDDLRFLDGVLWMAANA